jgi:SAM-dependent methyltransferases
MTVLDVGTGAGFYLPYLSKMVSDSGKVYAIDISPEAVEYARNKVSQLGLKNVEVLLSQENQIPLPDNTVDFTYMAFVFHELEDPVKFLKELERVSKPIGYLALIDWKKEERDKGPPLEEVYSEWEVGMILEEAGLRVEGGGSGTLRLRLLCDVCKAMKKGYTLDELLPQNSSLVNYKKAKQRSKDYRSQEYSHKAKGNEPSQDGKEQHNVWHLHANFHNKRADDVVNGGNYEHSPDQ